MRDKIVTAAAHPLYSAMLEIWEKNRDCYDGEDVIKDKGSRYLPATSGMVLDGFGSNNVESAGFKAYTAYKMRAYFAEIVRDAVESAVGAMHINEPEIQLPKNMEYLLDNATYDGESLAMLLRTINEKQLVTGRVGLLGDFKTSYDNKEEIVLIVYPEVSCFNWDDISDDKDSSVLRFVALDESSYEMAEDYSWNYVNKTRGLALTDKDGKLISFEDIKANNNVNSYSYGSGVIRNEYDLKGIQYEDVNVKGTTINRIPFTFINSKDLCAKPDTPPLNGLCNLALAIYRGEAGYRQNLFMQGQDTLVIVGANSSDDDEPVRTGAGSRINVGAQGDAKFIGTESNGLSEQRESLQNDYKRAEARTAKLVNQSGQESGEALKIRVAAQTATLPQIAITGAAGLQKVLRDMAVLFGENPDEVVVKPNLEFADILGDGKTLNDIIDAKIKGAPISNESIHSWLVDNKFTTKTFLDEMTIIDGEAPDGGLTD